MAAAATAMAAASRTRRRAAMEDADVACARPPNRRRWRSAPGTSLALWDSLARLEAVVEARPPLRLGMVTPGFMEGDTTMASICCRAQSLRALLDLVSAKSEVDVAKYASYLALFSLPSTTG